MRTRMEASPAAAATAFARRATFGVFCSELLRALAVLALTVTGVQLAVRFDGGHVPPRWWWSCALVPAVGFAWWGAARRRLSLAEAALHVDRRLGLHGLLLAAVDGAVLEPAWRARIAAALPGLRAVLPRVSWARVLPWPTFALLLATVVAALPPPEPPAPPPARTAISAEIERAAEKLRDLLARGQVPEETKHDLEAKVKELQQRIADGEVPEWRDVDQLQQRLDREQLLQAAAEPARDPRGAEPAAAADVSPQQVAAAANALSAAGLLDSLPPDLRSMLDAAKGERGVEAGGLPQDADALRRLAEAMAKAAGGEASLGDLAQKLGAGQLADLKAVIDAFAPNGVGQGEGAGQRPGAEGEQGVGRGGIDRGPGHAALTMTEDAQGAADKALPLPPGSPAPTEWVPVGSRPSTPDVAPVANTGAGGAAAAGTGGATWQLQLAPRHRAVVQRYFAAPTDITNGPR